MPADVSLISIKKICGKVNIVSEFLTARKGARQSRQSGLYGIFACPDQFFHIM